MDGKRHGAKGEGFFTVSCFSNKEASASLKSNEKDLLREKSLIK